MEKIKLVIVDDEKLIRSGLKMMLEGYDNLEIVAQAKDGKEGYELVKEYKADMVLMDIRMPEYSGLDGIRFIKNAGLETKILVLTTFRDVDYIVEAMNLGASGYLLKDSSDKEIYDAINLACSGKVILDSEISNLLLINQEKSTFEKNLDINLTEREKDYIKLVSKGYNNKEISNILFLSEGTVKNNISAILLKLNLRDRTQLAIFGHEHGIK
jgi:DNA-binding response regulator